MFQNQDNEDWPKREQIQEIIFHKSMPVEFFFPKSTYTCVYLR